MTTENQLIELCQAELEQFIDWREKPYVVKNSIPVLWFGDSAAYFKSTRKIITVSLNPSNQEFKEANGEYSTQYRFSKYNHSSKSLKEALDGYFKFNPYSRWFKASFSTVFHGFDASHYKGFTNTALHTDIATPYATDPTWSGLKKEISKEELTHLEGKGLKKWHELVSILEPDVILFSASRDWEKKIYFEIAKPWRVLDIATKSPLNYCQVKINNKICGIIAQTQGRKPFMNCNRAQKLSIGKFLSYA